MGKAGPPPARTGASQPIRASPKGLLLGDPSGLPPQTGFPPTYALPTHIHGTRGPSRLSVRWIPYSRAKDGEGSVCDA